MGLIHGIHHITAIASDPQRTVDFYTQVLGLRLVKKSVNQDDVQTYHLFFGDKTGKAGMDLTFFTFQPAMLGQRGTGQVTLISFAVPEKSLPWWQRRFKTLGVKHELIEKHFGTACLVFYDGDDQRLELVGIPREEINKLSSNIWVTDEISEKEAIRCFDSARLSVFSLSLIEPILTEILGYELIKKEKQLSLYGLPKRERGAYLEVEENSPQAAGITLAGTVHHIAFAVKDERAQLKVSQQLLDFGLHPTQVIDRYYFKSVYFRTPAGILFEIATEGPGFTVDEKASQLGQRLALPPFLEARREEIEVGLPPIKTR